MLFYRVKEEADKKPMFIKKRNGIEYWSIYVGGEVWCATGYDCQVNQKVTLVMNSNGTTNDIFDDIIEDVLWCCCQAAD